MTSEEFNKLSKEEKGKVKFKELPKFNRFAMVFFFATITLVMATCVGTCISSDDSKEMDSIHIEVTAKYKAEEAVKTLLKAPSTAEFPSETQRCLIMPDSTVVVEGSVDAQNTFGAMIRNNYYVKFKWYFDSNNDEIWSLIDVKLE